jgi:hypothetical protein
MFLVLPLALPAVFPQMRTSVALMRTTRERVIQQSYVVTARDVQDRDRQIAGWPGAGPAPAPLHAGDALSRVVVVPPKSIYWAQGIAEKDGIKQGQGMFYVEAWLFDRAFDLSANPYALNETMRYLYKILMPFLVLVVVSLLTAPDESESVRRFFLRMRTKVRRDRAEDERAVLAAYADPESTTAELLLPGTQFELFKWSREDVIGFSLSVLAAFAVLGLLYFLLNLGG